MFSKTVTLTLTEECLGTKPANKEVFAKYIESVREPSVPARKDELANAEIAEKLADEKELGGTTIFHVDEKNNPIIYDYQIRGFLKAAAGAMRQADDALSKGLTAYKSKISDLIFVFPRIIKLKLPEGAQMGICERPLRADTMQGPRVSLARSQTVPVGTTLTVRFHSLAAKIGKGDAAQPVDDLLTEWLNYGALQGLGQWRNSSKGRFTWAVSSEKI